MSNIFSKYKKELAGVQVVSSKSVWLRSSSGKYYLNPKYDIVGKVDYRFPNIVLKANKKGNKTAYVEDTSALTKVTKTSIVDYFFDKNGERNKNKTAYLVRADTKTASGSGVVSRQKTTKQGV